jgi:peptidoglycan hydrolase CwlO-like protein
MHPKSVNINNINDANYDVKFIISLIISILLLWLIAFHETNIIGMTYIDWIGADCDSSSSSSTGYAELDELLDDFSQDFSELCTQRQSEGYAIILATITTIIVTATLFTDKNNSENQIQRIRSPKKNLIGEKLAKIDNINEQINDLEKRIKLSKKLKSLYDDIKNGESEISITWGSLNSEINKKRRFYNLFSTALVITGVITSIIIYYGLSTNVLETNNYLFEKISSLPYILFSLPIILYLFMRLSVIIDSNHPLFILKKSLNEKEKEIASLEKSRRNKTIPLKVMEKKLNRLLDEKILLKEDRRYEK